MDSGVTDRATDEVKTLHSEARLLKEALDEVILESRLLNKYVIADGEDGGRTPTS